MMDCKAALQESGGDMAKAEDWLRKKGIAKASQKSERATGEGRHSRRRRDVHRRRHD